MEHLALTDTLNTLKNPYEFQCNLLTSQTPMFNETWMNFNETNLSNLMSKGWIPLTTYIRFSLLCCWNDARSYEPLRHGSIRYRHASISSPLRHHTSSRYSNKQNGTNLTPTLRANAWTKMNFIYGELRKWRRLLPLLLRRSSRLW